MPPVIIENPDGEPAISKPETGEAAGRDPKFYTDRDATLYPEAVAHILTPKRRRTTVSPETLAAMRLAVSQQQR